jgi:hypothetical protein
LRASAIKFMHKLAGHSIPNDDERCKATMRRIRRTVGVAPIKESPATQAQRGSAWSQPDEPAQ